MNTPVETLPLVAGRWGLAAGTPVVVTEVSQARFAELAPQLTITGAPLAYTVVRP